MVAGLIAGPIAETALAADHLDGPQASADPTADVTDVFAWMSPDTTATTGRVYLVMDVNKNASTTTKFSNSVLYALHTNSGAGFGTVPPTGGINIICSFDVAQKISCWVVGSDGKTIDYVNGDASATSGLMSTSGKVQVFAGLRDDPFFFYLDGFKHVAATVHQLAGTLTFDAAGCPMIDAATSQAAVMLLNGMAMGPAVDNFAKSATNSGNILSIVLSVDKAMLTPGGPMLSVWGSTNKPGM
jgi:hypothetical protein